MEIKILQVFYGKDGLPYKDKDRQVHFPITGTGFLGASNTTKIKFYYDELDNLDETSWVAVSKLPNGKVGSRVLESYLDEELNEHYALLELDNYYTQYKGDVFISLQGYQGGVDFDYDEENSQYEIHGTPTIAATGSIKFTINYANQFVGSGQTDNINFQRILAALGTKLGMRAYSEYVEELPSEGSPDVFYVVKDDPNNPNLKNIYVWNENTKHYIWVGDNTLDLGDYYTKEQGEQFESGIDGRVTSVENELSSVASGSPSGTYATVSALTSADPDHTKIYLVLQDGHWYYWNGVAWTDGGAYLSTVNAVPDTRKIAGVDLQDDITKAELQHALDVDRIELNQKEIELAQLVTLADKNSKFEVGAIYYGVGVVQVTETSYRTTDYVDISGYGKLDVTMITNAAFNNWGLCFFDASKQYISGIAPNTTGSDSYETRTVSVPSGAVYIRASFRYADLDNFYIKAHYELLNKVENAQKVNTATVLRQSKNYFDIDNATLDTDNNLLISPFVPVSLNDEFYLSAGENPFLLANYQFQSVRLYNANKQFIEMVYWVSPYKIISSNVKYVKFAVAQTQLPYIYVTKGGYNHHIYEPYFEEYYEGKDDTARQEIADKNSFLWASINMFDRVGGIGDSYTAGYALNSQNQGYTSAGKSWLGVLCKRAGVTMANYGYGGATTRSYITQELPTVLADTACDFYFLALGINDMTLGTSYIGSVADIDDSNPDNNADTFYGNYGKIIAKVKQKNPKALFVLIKLQNQGTNVMSAFNTAIEGLAEHYGIPVINPFDDLFFKSDLYTRMRDGHPTFLGYCGMGMAYERLFAKCVLENRLYFFNATIG